MVWCCRPREEAVQARERELQLRENSLEQKYAEVDSAAVSLTEECAPLRLQECPSPHPLTALLGALRLI